MFSIFISNVISLKHRWDFLQDPHFCVELHTCSVLKFLSLLSAPTSPFFNLTRENDMLISAPPLLGHPGVSRSETSAEEGRQRLRLRLRGRVTQPSITLRHLWTMTVICQEAGGGASLTRGSPAGSYTSLITISIAHLQGVAFFCFDEITGPLFPPLFPLRVHRAKSLGKEGRSGELGSGQDQTALGGEGCRQKPKEGVSLHWPGEVSGWGHWEMTYPHPSQGCESRIKIPRHPPHRCPQWRRLLDRNIPRPQIRYSLCFV